SSRNASSTGGSTSGCIISLPRSTPTTCAASSSASARGEATPASASTRSASRMANRSGVRLTAVPLGDRRSSAHGLRAFGRLQGLDDTVQVAVEHRGQVVGLVADAVVGDAVLREVVGADPLGAVDRAHLGTALVGGLRGR